MTLLRFPIRKKYINNEGKGLTGTSRQRKRRFVLWSGISLFKQMAVQQG